MISVTDTVYYGSATPGKQMASRLAEFRIEGLFGLYDHAIPLNHKDRITIVIGPNGRGKTVCLKFIEALFRKKYAYFSDIPFRTADFRFTTGESICIESQEDLIARSSTAEISRAIQFVLSAPGKEPIKWAPSLADSALTRELRKYVPASWQQVAFDLWVDRSDGEERTTAELVSRYPIPSKLAEAVQRDIPEGFAELIQGIDCHLIETQRLLVLPSTPVVAEEEYMIVRGHVRPRRESRLAIQQKAQKLKAILKDTLTTYANLSQSLDRSFPLRVFEAQESAKLAEDQLREELKGLDKRREALMAAGILDTDYQPVTIRGGNIERGVAKALEIYVRDATQKLDVFNALRARLDLFKELLERRFIDKTVHIDRENGFKIISKTRAEVPLEKLSSGEQHQLILIFDLLFEVKENSLILIDEPELSLHVAWQKTVIDSLRRIISLNSFDVLIATHSPALVARHLDLAVELGPVDDEP